MSEYNDLLKASSKSAKRKRKAKAAKKQAKRESSSWKPPSGYSSIPNSKKGGYRKMVGGKWDYKYPPAAKAKSGQSASTEDLKQAIEIIREAPAKAAAAAAVAQTLSQKLNQIARAAQGNVLEAMSDLGHWYKKKHHEIEEVIHMTKVASDFSFDPGQALDLMRTLSQMVMALDLDDDDEE